MNNTALTGNQTDILNSIRVGMQSKSLRNRSDLAMRFDNSNVDVNTLIAVSLVTETDYGFVARQAEMVDTNPIAR